MNLTKAIFDFFFFWEREGGCQTIAKVSHVACSFPRPLSTGRKGPRRLHVPACCAPSWCERPHAGTCSLPEALCIKDEGGCNLLNFMPISSSPWGSWKIANAITGLHKVWMSPPDVMFIATSSQATPLAVILWDSRITRLIGLRKVYLFLHLCFALWSERLISWICHGRSLSSLPSSAADMEHSFAAFPSYPPRYQNHKAHAVGSWPRRGSL